MIKVGDRITPKKDSEIYKAMKGYNLEFEIVEITDSWIKIKNECGFGLLTFGYGIISINELSQFDIVDKEKEKEKNGVNGIIVMNFKQGFMVFLIKQKADKLM